MKKYLSMLLLGGILSLAPLFGWAATSPTDLNTSSCAVSQTTGFCTCYVAAVRLTHELHPDQEQYPVPTALHLMISTGAIVSCHMGGGCDTPADCSACIAENQGYINAVNSKVCSIPAS